MKRIISSNWWVNITHNWLAKIVCLVIAIVLWAWLKERTQPGFIDMVWTGTLTTSP